MRHATLLALTAPLLMLGTACASGGGAPPTTNNSDRIIMTNDVGTVLHQTLNANAHMSFKAPVASVWSAVQAAYMDVGVDANTADRAAGRYGAVNFTFPRRLKGVNVNQLFNCGSSMTGPQVDQGRVTADVVSTLVANGDATDVNVYVDGVLRKNDGASSDPMSCPSTGRLEELLRASILKHLAT